MRRRVGTFLLAFGFLAIVYSAATVLWRDPLTDVYARWKQHQLTAQLDRQFEEFRAEYGAPATELAARGTAARGGAAGKRGVAVDVAAERKAVAAVARRFTAAIERGDALGRIRVPRLGIAPVFVNGTRWGADLSRGPGKYERTSLPGLGKTVAVAGHRTTFGAPFRNIDDLTPGDEITLELPYGTFRYVVFSHEIVDKGDWSIIREREFETLVLSACHPLYSANQRWVVYARLAAVERPGGPSFELPGAERLASAS